MVVAFAEDIKKLWHDTCTVSIQRRTEDPETGISSPSWSDLLTNEPCKLSFSSAPAASGASAASEVNQTIKLFTSSKIPAGARVKVTRDKEELFFMSAGIPEHFFSHYEIVLLSAERWA